jgi:hypothetical protein
VAGGAGADRGSAPVRLRPDEQRAITDCAAIPEWARLMLRIAWLTGLRQARCG